MQTLSRQGLSEKLLALYESRPKAYLWLANGFMGLGYVLITLLPLTFLVAALTITSNVPEAKSWDAWLSILIWLGVALLSGFMTLLMLRLRVGIPSGLGLKPDKAPKLYELLDELREIYKHPNIHRVVLHNDYGIDFIQVPRFGLPLLTVNVVYIGLPALQALSVPQFKALLGRKLGQYSMQHNRLTHLVYRFRQYVSQYQQAYIKHSRDQWFYLPFKWFFRFYVPWLNAVTIHAARRDELEADTYAMEVMSDEEFADTLIRYSVAGLFLEEKFWPKIQALLRKHGGEQPEFLPHSSMRKVLRNGLTDSEVAASLDTLIKKDPAWDDPLPGLHTRLDNMSYRNLSLPPPVLETAAQRLLGGTLGVVIKLFDQQWLAKQGIRPKKNSKTPASEPTRTNSSDEQQQYQTLNKKFQQGKLSGDDELCQLAALTEKYQDKAAAIGIYQQVLKHNATHAKTWFAIGRILLLQGDVTGVKALERAMELDSDCTPQACWILAKYYKATGNDALAKKYIAKSGRVSSNAAA